MEFLTQEKYCFIRDRQVYSPFQKALYRLKCISCNQQDHQLSNCPFVNLSLKHKPIKAINERNIHKRKDYRNHNIIKRIKFYQERALEAALYNDESLISDIVSAYQNTQFVTSYEEEQTIGTLSSSLVFSKASQFKDEQNLHMTNDTQQKFRSNPQIKIDTQPNNQKHSQKLIAYTSDHELIDKKFCRTKSFKCDEEQFSQYPISRATTLQENQQINEKLKQRDLSKLKNHIEENLSQSDRLSIKLPSKDNIRKMHTDESIDREKFSSSDRTERLSLFGSHSEKPSSQKSSMNARIAHQQSQFSPNNLEQTKQLLIQQTYERLKLKGKLTYKQLERSISDKGLDQISEINGQIQEQIKNGRQRSITDLNSIEARNNGLLNFFSRLASKQSNLNISKRSSSKKQETIGSSLDFNKKEEFLKQLTHIQNQPLNNATNTSINAPNQPLNVHKEMDIMYQNSSEYLIRCQLNLQDLDKLVVRKQFLMMQQKGQIHNYIQVPDNEIDIDVLNNYNYYYRSSNVKQVLHLIKAKQEEKSRDQGINQRKKRSVTNKRTPKKNQNTKSNFQKMYHNEGGQIYDQ